MREKLFTPCSAIIFALVFISGTLVEAQKPAGKGNPGIHSNTTGISAKIFYTAMVDDKNIKWFITDAGIVSFDEGKWQLHNENKNVPTQNIKGFAYDFSSDTSKIWLATPDGATVASLPIKQNTDATTYNTENTPLLSKNVYQVAIGKNAIRWFGTDKGISAFSNSKWLTPKYERVYPEVMFREYPITSMTTNRDGDSLYVGTDGAGVFRVFRNDVDGISGASEYAEWGPIIMPSDKVYSVCIAPDRTQWIGTDKGIAKHSGDNTLENWTVFTTDDGLVHNFVQAIAVDKKGKLWFGTKGGVSVYNGSVWSSFTINEGLISNNILSIAIDKNNIVWLGTDNGVMSYNNGEFSSYK